MSIKDNVMEREIELCPDTREWLDRPNTAWVQIISCHVLTVSDLGRLMDICRVTDEIPFFDPYSGCIEIGCIPDAKTFERIREGVDSMQNHPGRIEKTCALIVEYDGDEEDGDTE